MSQVGHGSWGNNFIKQVQTPGEMMKPTVDKVLKDVQLLSKRMRTREAFADELLNKVGALQSQLESMRVFQEETLEYEDIAKRAEKNPRKQLILCLAAENKQLEQLKMQNRTLETSLEEHELTLEMIMSKYREQISNLMRTNETERRMDHRNVSSNGVASQTDGERNQVDADTLGTPVATDERLAVMAAIAKEVAEQSEAYSAELEAELHRLNAENQALRELLAIETANSVSSSPAGAGVSTVNSNTAISSTTARETNGSATSKPGEEWAGVPIVFNFIEKCGYHLTVVTAIGSPESFGVSRCSVMVAIGSSDPDFPSLARLTDAVRDNTSSPIPSETRPSGVSLTHLSTAFAAGFALGAVVGLLSADALFSSHRLRSRNRNDHLEEQVEIIRRDLDQLRSVGRPSPVAFEVYVDDDEGAGEDDDEFFDVTSGMSGEMSSEISARFSSTMSLFSVPPPPDQPLPCAVAEELDALAAAVRLASSSSAVDAANRAFNRCLEYKKQYKQYPGFLWRFARASHLMWMTSTLVGHTAGSSSNSAGDGNLADNHWIDAGLSIARSAVRQVEAANAVVEQEAVGDAARSYQWLAIFLGLSATSSSTPVSQRIQLGYEFLQPPVTCKMQMLKCMHALWMKNCNPIGMLLLTVPSTIFLFFPIHAVWGKCWLDVTDVIGVRLLYQLI
ncbi:Circulating cathodic antigen [Echinococcus granulosus]|uniref:Circulating cathodic antigen n=1 Tax=Echinococcus granulosus TaxID=6210 RepID=W6UC38_ECHGR|nr:Circulating cathodic antigen [Echinococcus granulosus]EUB58146.1 Circulating cathodic antigen [Echinococcus granulosus]